MLQGCNANCPPTEGLCQDHLKNPHHPEFTLPGELTQHIHGDIQKPLLMFSWAWIVRYMSDCSILDSITLLIDYEKQVNTLFFYAALELVK